MTDAGADSSANSWSQAPNHKIYLGKLTIHLQQSLFDSVVAIGLALYTPVSWYWFSGPSRVRTLSPSLVLDLMVLEQVLPQGDLGRELCRAEVAADGVLGVGVNEADVVLQARYVCVVLIVNKLGFIQVSGRW